LELFKLALFWQKPNFGLCLMRRAQAKCSKLGTLMFQKYVWTRPKFFSVIFTPTNPTVHMALHSYKLSVTVRKELFLHKHQYINLEQNWFKGTNPYNNDPGTSTRSMSIQNFANIGIVVQCLKWHDSSFTIVSK
jgi:hypothetical protein